MVSVIAVCFSADSFSVVVYLNEVAPLKKKNLSANKDVESNELCAQEVTTKSRTAA